MEIITYQGSFELSFPWDVVGGGKFESMNEGDKNGRLRRLLSLEMRDDGEEPWGRGESIEAVQLKIYFYFWTTR